VRNDFSLPFNAQQFSGQNHIRPVYSPQKTTVLHNSQQQELPLRMVVNAKHVGAIIGQGGANIREITNESRAKCIVNAERTAEPNAEKVITIQGQLENCVKACSRILDITLRETQKETNTALTPEMKFRIPNQLVGRLIGKGGSSVKKIMEETTCFISISDARVPEKLPMHQNSHPESFMPMVSERLIIVKGPSKEVICSGVHNIFAKLRQFDSDDHSRNLIAPTSLVGFPNMSSMAHVTNNDGHCSRTSNFNGYMMPKSPYSMPPPQMIVAPHAIMAPVFPPELLAIRNLCRVHIFVPTQIVGALIGTKGTNIRNLMRQTGAHIRIEGNADTNHNRAQGNRQNGEAIEQTTKEGSEEETEEIDKGVKDVNEEAAKEGDSEELPNNKTVDPPVELSSNNCNETADAMESTSITSKYSDSNERCVAISGTDQQIYKAEFMIYQRVAETSTMFFSEVALNTEVFVPTGIVGRIIGKNGQNVKELQRITNSIVKVFEEANVCSEEAKETNSVRVTGNFFSVQAVQARISKLISDCQQRNISDQTSNSDQHESKTSRQNSEDAASSRQSASNAEN
jgi:transcription antitermination factor NusA-like protein